MDMISPSLAPIKSALFVDFDNIYIGLSKTDSLAAERFAADPARWLAWLERGLPGIPGVAGTRQRSILVRRCYPNPDAGFRRYRSFFTSAAFSVIDCPSLTRTGKNSSDIYMVMDILDILNHKTYFDEFIIFSGDSDFMPVLLRLRAHDRRTTTLAIDFMPPAFKAACDLVIGEEEFIEDALGVTQDVSGGTGENHSNGNYRARLELPVLKEMVQRVYEVVRQEGEVAGADLPDILKDFREFRESSNWLGFGTSQRLAEAMVYQEQGMRLVRINPMQYKLETKATVNPPATVIPPVVEVEQVEEVTADEPAEDSEEMLRRQIIAAVQEVVTSSTYPVLLARASQYVVTKLGPRVLESQWAGAGSFKKLLQGVKDLGLEITSQPEPGYIFHPTQHVHPLQRGGRRGGAEKYRPQEPAARYEQAEETAFGDEPVGAPTGVEETLPSLEEFARRVSRVTGVPMLTPEQYALVFEGMVRELQQIAESEKAYNTYQSSKSVSDWCAEQGQPVSHSEIAMIFKGIIFQDGVRFGKQPGEYDAHELARVMRENILALCQRSRLELSLEECQLLDAWIAGGLTVEDEG